MNWKTIFAVGAILLSGTLYAQTPDGETPANEGICDSESGAAYGLCNAYCEAMDCDSENSQASEVACLKVEDKWIKITGREYLPCDCPPPALSITAVDTYQVTSNSAVINWTTDVPSTSQVHYSTDLSYSDHSALNSELAEFHQVTLEGLNPYTIYNFKVESSIGNGNCDVVESPDYLFRTTR